ncbi:M56 family metallopeptidase [Sphingomonas sp. GB1N7]|uniref:M56 family metallopeptidase n=1 Tax=Parasphingomonas caseinilytica TaxID=3096158 RepID=UPI002FC930FD
MIAPGFLGWGIETLIASTVLMALVLLLRAPVRRAFGPDVAYALWALPALRMILPPLPASWREAAAAPIAAASDTITIYVVEPLSGGASVAPATESLALLTPIVAALWIVGAAGFLGWHAVQHLRFCRRMLNEQVRGTQMEGGIHLIETDAANGPLAFGVVRKYVAFPRDFVSRYDQDERDLALAHELGHHARHDLVANWAALGVLALHWFNPIAWRAFRAFRADQEIANDARVLAGLSPMARHAYACAIVKSAHGGAVSAACHLHTINDLKGRLKMLTTNKTSRTRLIGGAAAIALIGVAGLGLTASGTQAAETVRAKVETATGVNLAKFDITPPAPPAAPGVAQVAEPPAPPELPESANLPPSAPGEDRTIDSSTTTKDGKVVKRIKVVVRDKDGKVRTEDWHGMDELKNMPEVSSANCPGGDAKQMVINEKKGGRQRIIICTNRIEKVASDGAKMAANSKDIQRNALQTAIASLRATRASMEANKDMPAEGRAEAIKGIDEAIAEVTAEMSKAD